MKILIFTSMHERHTISTLWCIGMQRFINDCPYKYEVDVAAVVTHIESKHICEKHGFYSIRYKNEPLGDKFNSGLSWAMGIKDYDYVIIFGDDDLISSYAWENYRHVISENIHYAGFGDIYMWEPVNKKSIVFKYGSEYSESKLIGCGRIISSKAIYSCGLKKQIKITKKITSTHGNYFTVGSVYNLPEYQADYIIDMGWAKQMGNTAFQLWSPTQNIGLDNESELTLIMGGYLPTRLITKAPLMVDVKSDKNIWPINRYIAKSPKVDEAKIRAFLSYDELNYIYSYLSKPTT